MTYVVVTDQYGTFCNFTFFKKYHLVGFISLFLIGTKNFPIRISDIAILIQHIVTIIQGLPGNPPTHMRAAYQDIRLTLTQIQTAIKEHFCFFM